MVREKSRIQLHRQPSHKCLGINPFELGVDMTAIFPRVQVYQWVIWTILKIFRQYRDCHKNLNKFMLIIYAYCSYVWKVKNFFGTKKQILKNSRNMAQNLITEGNFCLCKKGFEKNRSNFTLIHDWFWFSIWSVSILMNIPVPYVMQDFHSWDSLFFLCFFLQLHFQPCFSWAFVVKAEAFLKRWKKAFFCYDLLLNSAGLLHSFAFLSSFIIHSVLCFFIHFTFRIQILCCTFDVLIDFWMLINVSRYFIELILFNWMFRFQTQFSRDWFKKEVLKI